MNNSKRYAKFTLLLIISIFTVLVATKIDVGFAETPPAGNGVPKPEDLRIYLPWTNNVDGKLGPGYAYGETTHIGTENFAIDFNFRNNDGQFIFPAAPGVVVYSGWWGAYGNTVVVRHDIGDDYYYYSQYAHLEWLYQRVRDIGPDDQPVEVLLSDLLGKEGNTGGDFGVHLHFSLRRCDREQSIWIGDLPRELNNTGVCSSVVPEPIIGEHVYEGLDWWDKLDDNVNEDDIDYLVSKRPSNYFYDTSPPTGSWGENATKNLETIKFGQIIEFDVNYSDIGSGIGEIRFTAYYDSWPDEKAIEAMGENADDLDPKKVWRIIARCVPGQGFCGESGTSFLWNPYQEIGLSTGDLPVPWLPKASPTSNLSNPVDVCISFDVFDKAGNRMYAPNGANCVLTTLSENQISYSSSSNDARRISIIPLYDTIPSPDDVDFITDITLPNGTAVSPGESLIKTWRVQNTSSTTWGSGYKLVFINGEQMGAPSTIDIPSTPPGNETNLSIPITVPTSLGDHTGYWRLRNPSGTYFGPFLSVSVNSQISSSQITINVDPPSPADTNMVRIYTKIDNIPNFRAQRIKVDGQIIYELGAPEIYFDWSTVGYSSGNHVITVEAADWTDTSWARSVRKSVVYDLLGTTSSTNHRPFRPSPASPHDWTVYYSGNTAELCAYSGGDPDGDAITGYYFDIFESAQLWNSGWVGSKCVTTSGLGPYNYQWQVKVRDSRGSESEWSESWHFTMVNPELTITELYFEPLDPNSEQVRVRACTEGQGGVGITMKVSVNTANDGSDSGQWRVIHELGVPCYNDIDAPIWGTLDYGDGSHLVRVEAHGSDTSWDGATVREEVYVLPHRKPNNPSLISPVSDNHGEGSIAYLNDLTNSFIWSPTERTNAYKIRISTNPNPFDDPSPIFNHTQPAQANQSVLLPIGDNSVGDIVISNDGNIIVYENGGIMVYDLNTNTVEDITVENARGGFTWSFGRLGISSDHRYIVYTIYAPDMDIDGERFVCDKDNDGQVDQECSIIFLYDQLTKNTSIISNSIYDRPALGDNGLWGLSISSNGRYITFASDSIDLIPNDYTEMCQWGFEQVRCKNIFLYDLYSNEIKLISVAPDGSKANGNSIGPSISSDGRYITYTSKATNLVHDDTTGEPYSDVFVYDTITGITKLISRSWNGVPAEGYNGDRSWSQVISGNGRYIAYASDAETIVRNDTNNANDVFLYDQFTGKTTMVSVSTGGVQGNAHSGASYWPQDGLLDISDTGRFVTYGSEATNLSENNPNSIVDIFLHDTLLDTTRLVSASSDGFESNGDSFHPVISSNGDIIAFVSYATDLSSLPVVPDRLHIYIRNMQYDFMATLDQVYHDLYWQVTATNDFGESYSEIQHVSIDLEAPTCHVEGLPQTTNHPSFPVSWIGSDETSGIKSNDIQYMDLHEGKWREWQKSIPPEITSANFQGLSGHDYAFRCRSTDNAGNVGNYPDIADTMTRIDLNSEVQTNIPNSTDLILSKLEIYPSPISGVIIQAVVENQGNTSTVNGFFTDLFIDELPLDLNDFSNSVHYWVNEPLAPGETLTLTANLSALPDTQQLIEQASEEWSGTLYARADSTNSVIEINEENSLVDGIDFCLAMDDEYEGDDLVDDASIIYPNLNQLHNFSKIGDIDWISFEVAYGKSYRISTNSLAENSDTLLELFDTDGITLLDSNDDSYGSLASEIIWTAPEDDTYFILVRNWNPNISGCGTSYSIQIEEIGKIHLPLIFNTH